MLTTSKGAQRKFKTSDGSFVKLDLNGGEAVTECLITEFLLASGYSNFLPYKIYNNTLTACVSPNMLSFRETIIPFSRLVPTVYGISFEKWYGSTMAKMPIEVRFRSIQDVYSILGIDVNASFTYLKDMFSLDILFRNTDRHFGNFGLISANNRYRLPLIYDNGGALATSEQWNNYFSESRFVLGNTKLIRMQPLSTSIRNLETRFPITKFNFDLQTFINIHDNQITTTSLQFRLFLKVLERAYPMYYGRKTSDILKSIYGDY